MTDGNGRVFFLFFFFTDRKQDITKTKELKNQFSPFKVQKINRWNKKQQQQQQQQETHASLIQNYTSDGSARKGSESASWKRIYVGKEDTKSICICNYSCMYIILENGKVGFFFLNSWSTCS